MQLKELTDAQKEEMDNKLREVVAEETEKLFSLYTEALMVCQTGLAETLIQEIYTLRERLEDLSKKELDKS